jgi:dihydroflavonol-4-reductase
MRPTPSFWAGRPVCVTGGTGFLGGHLVRQLLDLRADVQVFALPPRPDHPLLHERRVLFVAGDLLDESAVRRGVAGAAVVFHTAGLVATWGPILARMHAVHVEGTRHVLAAAPRARVVHTSSLVAVGASRLGEPVTEDWPFNLRDLRVAYVQAKRAAEEVAGEAANRGQDVVVVNPSYLVGPEDHDRSVMGRLCQRFWKGRLPAAPPGGLNLVDVRDAARGHLLAAERGEPGRRYLLGGQDCSLRELFLLLARAAGYRPRGLPTLPGWPLRLLASLEECRAWLTGKAPCPSTEDVRTLRWFWYCRSERARRELGYRPRSLPETLADTYRWYRDTHGGRVPRIGRWWFRPQPADTGRRRAA